MSDQTPGIVVSDGTHPKVRALLDGLRRLEAEVGVELVIVQGFIIEARTRTLAANLLRGPDGARWDEGKAPE